MQAPDDALILIIDPGTSALLGSCAGPDAQGNCPAMRRGEFVRCAGRTLRPARGTGAEGWRFIVPERELDTCPLAWLMALGLG
jgi:hypothetical protein